MSRTDRADRRQERLDREALEPAGSWLAPRLVPYFAVLAFLVVLGTADDVGDPGAMAVPLAATALFWGAGIANGFLRRNRRRAELGAQRERTDQPTRDRAAPRTPEEPPASVVVPPPAGRIPEEIRDLHALCERVRQTLLEQNEPALAARLGVGLTEVTRLARLIAASRTEAKEEDELRAEVEALRNKASAARDEEARALWARNAETATRRLQKLAEVSGAMDRAEARIESFRQTLKSLSVDLTRLALTTSSDQSRIAERARQVESEVDLLVRTQHELSSLESGVHAPVPELVAAPNTRGARASVPERQL